MKVRIQLQGNETQQEAEENLVKAITSKYDVSKIPHPDNVVNELTLKFKHEYNKMLVAMMSDIFEVIRYPEEFGKARGYPIGTHRTWSGVEHVKTAKGWEATGKVSLSTDRVDQKINEKTNMIGKVDLKGIDSKTKKEVIQMINDANKLVARTGFRFEEPVDFEWHSTGVDKVDRKGSNRVSGDYSPSLNKIRLFHGEVNSKTLFHEIGHAIDASMSKTLSKSGIGVTLMYTSRTMKSQIPPKMWEDLKELKKLVKASPGYIRSHGVGSKKSDYYRNHQEVFARAFEVYCAEAAYNFRYVRDNQGNTREYLSRYYDITPDALPKDTPEQTKSHYKKEITNRFQSLFKNMEEAVESKQKEYLNRASEIIDQYHEGKEIDNSSGFYMSLKDHHTDILYNETKIDGVFIELTMQKNPELFGKMLDVMEPKLEKHNEVIFKTHPGYEWFDDVLKERGYVKTDFGLSKKKEV